MKKISIIALAALVLAGCGQKKDSQSQAQQAAIAAQPKAQTVKVQPAAKQEVKQDGTYSATVQAFAVNNIAPQSGGRIQKINVEVGDYVGKGQILAEMDRVQLDQAKLRLSNAETELGRLKQLYEQGGLAQSDYEAAELNYKVSKSTYDNLVENTILRSPITGVVTARYYDRGDMYGMASPIFTVQQITPVKILVGISEGDYTKVSKGDKVTLSVDALPGKTFAGTIKRIYPTIDPMTHTVNVEVQVPNTDRQLRPGMYAKVNVTFGHNRSIVVPDAAVVRLQGSGQRNVFVVEDGIAVQKEVSLGRHFDGQYEILSGLEEGEQVVVKGGSALRNGAQVEVIE
ncbi:MAG: efflux RND transporter periplasmic adaptor subunit [Bacteroidales bacterium]|nr:efflux RND transporter periplasmic adaptor subunit [Bacteroidales bacterium]